MSSDSTTWTEVLHDGRDLTRAGVVVDGHRHDVSRLVEQFRTGAVGSLDHEDLGA